MGPSPGCEYCRIRRIKCDMVRPECSQCLRVSKKCSGYRDWVSLMFRNENTKTMKRAHKKWGVPEPSDDASSSSGSSSSGESTSSPSSKSRRGSPAYTGSTPSPRMQGVGALALALAPRIPMAVSPTVAEQGTRFYIERYVFGYPQEPATAADFHTAPWFSSPLISDVMAAVGLSALANLTGSEEMSTTARQRYAVALGNTHRLLRNPAELDPPVVIRAVVLLAMYEVVSGTAETADSIRTHILGAAALMNALLPKITDVARGFRGVVQLCFTMTVPCYMAGVNLPGTALNWIGLSANSLPPKDRAATDLVLLSARFIQLSIQLKSRALRDRTPQTAACVSEALELDAQLERWEAQQQQPATMWSFTTETGPFPPEAAFEGRYHVYAGGMWTAFIWNHYRWVRILVNETILGLADRFPGTTSAGMPAGQDRGGYLDAVRCQAEDLLVSVPTHYRHPALDRGQRALLDQTLALELGTSRGSSGLPVLLVQLQVAACAPGVPRRHVDWVLQLFDAIWAETGMLQAKSLAGAVRAQADRSRTVVEIKSAEAA